MNTVSKAISLLIPCIALFACGSSDDRSALPRAGDDQTPPTTADASAMTAWLDAGHYKGWQCEAEPHAARGPSTHNMNRACSNDLVSAFDGTATTERPIGSASVKEFWSDGKIVGRAASVKTADRSAAGDAWFWYVELDGMGVLANGLASQDPVAKTACVGCHTSAGSDVDHTTSNHSGDFVYTQVEP